MPHRAIVLAEETWISARALDAWLEAGHEVAEVWCPPRSSLARPLRQPLSLAFPRFSVRRIIRRHGIRMHQCGPLRAWPEAAARAEAVSADVLLNLFGLQIIPASLLDHFAGRALNVHPALLPRFRGPCPRLAMLAEGRSHDAGGVCLHVLTEGVDEGPLIDERRVPYPDAGGYAEWDAALADAAADLVASSASAYLDGSLAAMPQDESLACYRRPVPGELDIGPSTTLAHAERLVATLGPAGRLVCRPATGTTRRSVYRVSRIAGVIGRPTGRPARVGLCTLELDLADARVCLRRRSLRDRLRGQREAIAAMRRRARAVPSS
jgi:methionyl-tRNA formyltransferase